MTWFDWAVVGFIVLSMIGNVSMIGKPRKPISQGQAIVQVIIGVVFIIAILVTNGTH